MNRGMVMLPPTRGHCRVCAAQHGPHEPHNYWSMYYHLRFGLRHGREPTHADAVAHLPSAARDIYRQALHEFGQQWSEPPGGHEPIAEEPIAQGDG